MSAVIFSGNFVKALKTGLNLFNNATIWSGNVDPSAVGFPANIGDIYLSTSTGFPYSKQGLLDTDWAAISTVGGSWKTPVADEASLPVSGNVNGDIRVALDTGTAFEWNGSSWQFLNPVKIGAFGSTPNANGLSVVAATNTINLQPASLTNPGAISTIAQTFGGAKTFDGTLNADGGIDVSTGGDTLSIGSANAAIINIGNSGATVNIQGTTIYENTPQLLVADPTITVNAGGGAGSGQGAGIEVEEAGIATGYATTSSDRNSWTLKAPATAGIATITPGASGINIDQSSHDPVTLGAVGSSPNSDGATLTGQVLNLEPADATNPGVLTSSTQTIGGNKTFTGTVSASNLSGTNTGDVTLTAVGSSPNANGVSLSGQALTLQPADASNPGVLTATAQTIGGSKTFGSSILAISDNTIDIGSASASFKNIYTRQIGNSTHSNLIDVANEKLIDTNSIASIDWENRNLLDSAGGTVVSWTPTAINANTHQIINVVDPSLAQDAATKNYVDTAIAGLAEPGDIRVTSFTASNNQAVAANVTGFSFANASVRAFTAEVSVTIIATSSLYENYTIKGIQRASDWAITQVSDGDLSGLSFSINASGQIQYTTPNYPGFTSATLKFRARALPV